MRISFSYLGRTIELRVMTPKLANYCIICLNFDIIAYNFVIIQWIVFLLGHNYICDNTFKPFKLNLTLTFKSVVEIIFSLYKQESTF